MKVLIAEDDSVSRQILKKMLSKCGYDVLACRDGAEAWERLQAADRPNLAILDWMMPELDGVELVRRVRSLEQSDYIYTILLTARNEQEDIIKGLETGADDYLTKPFNREELVARLRAGERIINLEQILANKNHEFETANVTIIQSQ